jgi:hypothetical protein
MSESVLEHTPDIIKSMKPDRSVLGRFADSQVGVSSGLVKDLYGFWGNNPDDPLPGYSYLDPTQVWSALPFEIVATVFKSVDGGLVNNFEDAAEALANSLRLTGKEESSRVNPTADNMSSYTQDVGFFLCVFEEWLAKGEGRQVTQKIIDEIKFIKEGVEGKQAWQRGGQQNVGAIKDRLTKIDAWLRLHSKGGRAEA